MRRWRRFARRRNDVTFAANAAKWGTRFVLSECDCETERARFRGATNQAEYFWSDAPADRADDSRNSARESIDLRRRGAHGGASGGGTAGGCDSAPRVWLPVAAGARGGR